MAPSVATRDGPSTPPQQTSPPLTVAPTGATLNLAPAPSRTDPPTALAAPQSHPVHDLNPVLSVPSSCPLPIRTTTTTTTKPPPSPTPSSPSRRTRRRPTSASNRSPPTACSDSASGVSASECGEQPGSESCGPRKCLRAPPVDLDSGLTPNTGVWCRKGRTWWPALVACVDDAFRHTLDRPHPSDSVLIFCFGFHPSDAFVWTPPSTLRPYDSYRPPPDPCTTMNIECANKYLGQAGCGGRKKPKPPVPLPRAIAIDLICDRLLDLESCLCTADGSYDHIVKDKSPDFWSQWRERLSNAASYARCHGELLEFMKVLKDAAFRSAAAQQCATDAAKHAGTASQFQAALSILDTEAIDWDFVKDPASRCAMDLRSSAATSLPKAQAARSRPGGGGGGALAPRVTKQPLWPRDMVCVDDCDLF